jgi:hypothetical protein
VVDHVTDVARDPDARPVGAVEVDRDDRLVVDVVDLREVVELRSLRWSTALWKRR